VSYKSNGSRIGEKNYKEPATRCEYCLKDRRSEWSYPSVNGNYLRWPVVDKQLTKAHPRQCETCREDKL